MAHKAPLTHFGINDSELVALCKTCLEFELNLSQDNNDDEVYYGPLEEAVEMAIQKTEELIQPFDESIDKVENLRVRFKSLKKIFKSKKWEEAENHILKEVETKEQLIISIIKDYFLELKEKTRSLLLETAKGKSFQRMDNMMKMLRKRVTKLETIRNSCEENNCSIKDLQYIYKKDEDKNRNYIEEKTDYLIAREEATCPVIPRDVVKTNINFL